VTIPLWNRNQGAVRIARGDLAEAEADALTLRAQIEGEVERLMRRDRVTRELAITYRQEIIPAATETLSIARFSLEQGEASLLVWLEARRSYLEVLRASYSAQLEAFITRAELERLTGEFNETEPTERRWRVRRYCLLLTSVACALQISCNLETRSSRLESRRVARDSQSLVAGCGRERPSEPPDTKEESPSRIQLGEEAYQSAGIEVAPAGRHAIESELRVNGTLGFDEGRMSRVSASSPGRITRILAAPANSFMPERCSQKSRAPTWPLLSLHTGARQQRRISGRRKGREG
jgi:hypothetical protein